MIRVYGLGLLLLVCGPGPLAGQNNMTLSNPVARQVLLGNYDPVSFTPSVVINNADSLLNGLIARVSKDTLQVWLQKIDTYQNRNTGSDTVSQVRGIGAVRRWIFSKFNEISAGNENRLVTTYMDFDEPICGQPHHRNVMAVLPGLDTTNKEILVLEGHFDTRCNVACDTSCYTPGMEDNGSGTVLVMELARVLSRYAFNHTILFACVTGEDQGLWGSKALATWLYGNGIQVRACLNNDVIGGIICGTTSSPPCCPYFNHMDSTHVRIFSFSPFVDSTTNSPHKQLARYIKMHQVERINPLLATPMAINIMLWEDRQGRSGDQIPFRQKGYTAIRFCSQNEHGNGAGIPPDRQHTSDDVLGLDLSVPPDGVIDTFFVDMNYLRRNTIMNGLNLAFLALAPPRPDPEFTPIENGIRITLSGPDTVYKHYRVGTRSKGSGTLYFDTIYTFMGTAQLQITGLDPEKEYYFSVSSVENHIESQFSNEFTMFPVGVKARMKKNWGLNLKQNRPNPFTDHTVIEIEALDNRSYPDASIVVRDMAGRVIKTIPVSISSGSNSVEFSNTGRLKGIYTYSLNIRGTDAGTEKMAIY
jgi:hypothetical protein